MEINNLTEFIFYKNTPLTNFVDTIYFRSNEERDKFFDTKYSNIRVKQPFNFIKDRLTVRVKGQINNFKDVNYCRFYYPFDGITYYCFVPEYKYLNDNTIELNLIIDGIMTFCQGEVLDNLKNITVIREHLNKKDYKERLPILKNNDDVIKTYTKHYFYEEKKIFSDYSILIQSNANLFQDFGDEDNPKISSGTGAKVDKITSPVDLYITDSENFWKIMFNLTKYPWITQNFTKIIMIPSEFINTEMEYLKLEEVENSKVNLKGLYKITGGGSNFKDYEFFKDINKSNEELLKLFDLEEDEQHLLRNEYSLIEVYNYFKDSLFVDVGKLNEKYGLMFKADTVSGYFNDIHIYIYGYKSSKHYTNYVNDSISFSDFDEVPILIDNFKLSLSKNANQRKLAQDNTLKGKISRIVDNENNIEDRLVASISVLSSITSISSIGNMLIDDYNFYKNMKATEKDLSLTPDTVTSQTYSNSLNIKNNNHGLVVKYAKPNKIEMDKVKKYYKLFGYDINEFKSGLSDTRSMKRCNYVQFKGNYSIPKAERSIEDSIKILFENGVRLWHNIGVENPFTYGDILDNKIVR